METNPSTASIPAAFVTVDSLVESGWNPRRRGGTDLDELTQSIKEVGVLQPLLVRPLDDDRFEIVAGARRFRAAKAAGLTAVPVRVLHVNDEAALEVAITENLQREDVHPLDETAGFEKLRERYSIEAVAARVGKPVGYVHQRLQLRQLTTKVRKAFEKDELSLGHALLIARLQPKEQEECLIWGGRLRLPELKREIGRRFFLDLSKVPWPTKDASLVPKAGTCQECPKRAGTLPSLFEDMAKGATCTDPACFASKAAAYLKRRAAELGDAPRISTQPTWDPDRNKAMKADGVLLFGTWHPLKGSALGCSKTADALVIDGRDAGKTLKVCTQKNCRIHNPQEEKPARAAESPYRPDPEKAVQREVNERLHRAVVQDVNGLTEPELCLVAQAIWPGALEVPEGIPVDQLRRPVPRTSCQAAKVLVVTALEYDPGILAQFAKGRAIDAKAIEREVRKAAADAAHAKSEKKAKGKPPAKAKGKGRS